MTLRRSGTVTLEDGRELAYVEYGDPTGIPMFYFHGWPGAAVEVAHGHADCEALGIRLVAVDRPGMGGSGFQPKRCLLDWPKDVAFLADQLKFDRFHVLGVSGGGPYATACAYALADRIHSVGLVCPMGPPDHPDVVSSLPKIHKRLLKLGNVAAISRVVLGPAKLAMTGGMKSPLVRWGAALVRALKPAADKRVLADPAVLGAKVHAGQEAFRDGARGVAWDGHVLASPWGFAAEEVTVPVRLWHGELDKKVPPIMSRVLAGAIPDSVAVYYPDAGHSSIYVDHLREMLEGVLAAAS